MTVTNNRKKSSTFYYVFNDKIIKIKFKAFEKKVIENLLYVDQINSQHFIINNLTYGINTAKNLRIVDQDKVINNQTDGFWEIED